MTIIENGIRTLNDFLWGWPMILLLLGTHLFLTMRTKVIQRFVFRGIRWSLDGEKDGEGEVSSFGALTTALASTMGTGNIIGVGTAIALGGPGAVFWCWLTGLLGIATKYGEALIAVKYRVKTEDGRMQGGAMYALERGLHMKGLALAFAFFGAMAAFGIGCGVQANAIGRILEENLSIPPEFTGLAVAAGAAVVIFGGIKNIARICERLVPFMCIFYAGGCGLILVWNYDFILPAIRTILVMAFQPGAAAGGLMGGGLMMAMRYGIARGLFSNESGMGSAPIAAAAARSVNPVQQALISSTGTFWDTVVVCAITGLVLVTSILKNPAIDMASAGDGGGLTTLAFAQIPVIGPGILIIGIVSFAFSTILGWSYYGERCMEYLFGSKSLFLYRFFYVLVAAAAPLVQLNLVWDLSDVLNGCMALQNLVALLFLSGEIKEETEKYLYIK
ncbi:MAG: sodium:alanine symporter family protein [Clostridia bacterium]|nr:amino acid carrier protein [Lachnospiraceae bacterium]NCC00508.1 sodium:alanine symporter family protein [Clostridia bacterium]NCD02517.1 sodium:alanine symporter family protein [Clostridia bacterium]